jgi:uncharacterized protein with von Willebrand factor type A (vWA) domain
MAVVIVALFEGMALWDRRSRRRGHRLRSVPEMRRAERDVRSNIRASWETGMNPVEKDWHKSDEARGFLRRHRR